MIDLGLFTFADFDAGDFTHLSQLIERRAIVVAQCAHCREKWHIRLPTLRYWRARRGNVPLTQMLGMKCQAGREGRGCGKRGVLLQWAVPRSHPEAFDQRAEWNGWQRRKLLQPRPRQ